MTNHRLWGPQSIDPLELDTCPFCGGTAEAVQKDLAYAIKCQTCGAQTEDCRNLEVAYLKWHTRVYFKSERTVRSENQRLRNRLNKIILSKARLRNRVTRVTLTADADFASQIGVPDSVLTSMSISRLVDIVDRKGLQLTITLSDGANNATYLIEEEDDE